MFSCEHLKGRATFRASGYGTEGEEACKEMPLCLAAGSATAARLLLNLDANSCALVKCFAKHQR